MSLKTADQLQCPLVATARFVRIFQLALALSAVLLVCAAVARPLTFDDAFMFYRYALHIRHGLGVSWNPDGRHTYGETSPLWGFIVLVASYLPLSADRVLLLASSVSSVVAVAALSIAVARNARSLLLRNPWIAAALIVVPFCFSRVFLLNTRNGMETMLAIAVNAGVCGSMLAWLQRPTRLIGILIGAMALVGFLLRPESVLPAVIAIALCAVTAERIRSTDAAVPVVALLAGLAACLLGFKAYFGTFLPLALHVKAHGFYQGFTSSREPVERALDLVAACIGPVLLIVWFVDSRSKRLLLTFLIPFTAVVLYLFTVQQIMGHNSRYYLPYCPYLFIPAFAVLDRWLANPPAQRITHPLQRVIVSAVVVFMASRAFPGPIAQALDRIAERPGRPYPEARRVEAATSPLPSLDWATAWRDLTDGVVVHMPPGATVAATEVGYMGAMAPRVTVIDLSGLNDPQIALHGFNMQSLLDRKPDLVWLPFPDYTRYRAQFFESGQFLSDYTIYDGALNYGIALRRDSPLYGRMRADLRRLWAREYPGTVMEDYIVRSASVP